jgi:hypothetical protein
MVHNLSMLTVFKSPINLPSDFELDTFLIFVVH